MQPRSALATVLLTGVCLLVSLLPLGQSPSRPAPVASASAMAPQGSVHHAYRTAVPAAVVRRRALHRAARTTAEANAPQEIPALRTRTSDTYLQPNGVYTVHEALQSINYQDASGAWQPIDDSLVPATPDEVSAGFAYRNKANGFTAAFAATSGAGALVRLTQGNAALSFTPQDARAASGTVSGDTITYSDLFTHTDALYTVGNDKLKESLVLRDASAPASFAFALRLDGAHLPALGAGVLATAGAAVLDAAGQEQFRLLPLVAADAKGATTPVTLTLAPLAGQAGAAQVVATIPPAWLADPARAWPVVLDPGVVLQPSKDRMIDSRNLHPVYAATDCPYGPGDNRCDPSTWIESVDLLGADYGYTPPTVVRTLLQFDLSGLPRNVTLLNATLTGALPRPDDEDLTKPFTRTVNATLVPISRSWTMSATWTTTDGTHAWTTPGGDYDPTYHVTAGLGFSNGIDDVFGIWNITDLVRQLYLGSRVNNGVLLKMDDEVGNSPRRIEWDNALGVTYSYIPWQGGAAPGGERAFDPHAALKSDRALITFPQGDGQQLGVNVTNGDLEIMRNDLGIPSIGIPNVIQRTFHSSAGVAGATSLGHRWQLSVGGDVSLAPQQTGDAIYVDPTGQGFDIPSAVSTTVSTIVTDTATQGSWVGHYGGDGYVLNGWNGGSDTSSLPSYVAGYQASGTRTTWQANTTDQRAIVAPSGGTRNATALSDAAQTQQVVSFNARTLITATVYVLNWGGGSPITSTGEYVQVTDAIGPHSYHAAAFDNGVWITFTNLRAGPTQPLTVTVSGDAGSSAVSSALMFDGGVPAGFGRAQALPADLSQNSDGSYALSFNNGLVEHFSAGGRYTSVSDRHNNSESFSYGGGTGGSCGAGQIGAITDTVGRTTTFGCSGSLITGITDAASRGVHYDYDANNNLSYFTDRAGGVTHYEYNAASEPVTITDPISNQTIITYDASLRVSAVQDGAGSVTTFSYGATTATTVTDALNDQTVFSYDPATGAILSVKDPNGNVTTSAYDGNTLLQTTTDPLGHVITNTTTAGSDETSTTSPLGDGSAAAYNALHEPTVITDTQGQGTTTQYNAAGDPITVTDPLNNTTIYTYTASGLQTAVTDGNRHTTLYGYDAYGDTVAITDALGRVSAMTYTTSIGRLSAVSDPKHQSTSFSYDAEDRPLQSTYQDSSTTRNLIDADGNITQTVDSAGTTSYQYDRDNRLTQVTYPDGAVVAYSYDAAGRLATKSEPGLPLTTYSYDAGGRLTRIANSLFGPITYGYDAASRLTSLGYPNGITTTYTEDADNRVIALNQAKGASSLYSESFSYAKPGGGTWGLRGSEAITDAIGATTWSYGYDADARLTSASGVTSIDDAVQGSGSNQFAYVGSWTHCACGVGAYAGTSSADSHLADSVTIPFTGTSITYYAVLGSDEGKAAVSIDGGGGTLIDLYRSFPQGNVPVWTSATLANGPHTLTISVSGQKNPSSSGIKVLVDRVAVTDADSYGYDAVGNLTSNNGTSQGYDAANQLTAAGGITYTYDSDGNQTATSESVRPQWSYDAQNHTTAYSDTSALDSFLVGAGGQRAKKSTTQGGTTTTGRFDGDMYRQTAPVSTTIYYEADPGGRLLALTDGTTVYYYGLDGHGSVVNLTNGAGAVVNSYPR